MKRNMKENKLLCSTPLRSHRQYCVQLCIPPIQEGHGPTAEGPEECHKDRATPTRTGKNWSC